MIPFKADVNFMSSNLAETLNYLQSDEAKIEKDEIDLRDFNVNSSGEITIDGQINPITRSGLVNLCSYMGIPNPFARKIPNDLLVHNLNRLRDHKLEASEDLTVNLFRNSHGHLIDFTKKDVIEIPDLSFLQSYADANLFKFRYNFGNHFSKSEIYFNEQPFKAGKDEHILGWEILNFATGRKSTTLAPGLFTLVCTNGMTVCDEMFKHFEINNWDARDLSDIVYPLIAKNVQKKNFDKVEQIKNALNELEASEVAFGELKYVLRKFKRILRDEGIEEKDELFFGQNVDMHKAYNTAKEEKFELKDLLNVTTYDIFYQLTYVSSNTPDISFKAKQQINHFAGKLLVEDLKSIKEK